MGIAGTLERLRAGGALGRALLGFDAFVDCICGDLSGLGGGSIETMSELGMRLMRREENSGCIALHGVREVAGGNMPNTAKALCALGAAPVCIGAFGASEIHRAFAPLAQRCSLISYADPGMCMALEFSQSKLFLANNGVQDALTWGQFVDRVGWDVLRRSFGEAEWIGLFNWGELLATQRIWTGIAAEVLPGLPRGKTFFVDFSDMSGRSEDEIAQMLDTLGAFRRVGRVIASVNQGEWDSLSKIEGFGEKVADVLVLHTSKAAFLYSREGVFEVPTHFAEAPALLTGGGDSFNGGFLYGLMCGLSLEECLITGNAVSGLYVRRGQAPTKDEVMEEIRCCERIWRES